VNEGRLNPKSISGFIVTGPDKEEAIFQER